jgi:hypothetical protein
MTLILVLTVIVAISALAPVLGRDTRTPELHPRH